MAVEDIEFQIVDVDVAAAYEDAQQLSEQYPYRAPAVVAQAIRPYVKDKIVCDLGCGGGDLLWLMSRYAKKAIGVEVDDRRSKHAQARAACTDSMEFLSLDYFQEPIPKADVYAFRLRISLRKSRDVLRNKIAQSLRDGAVSFGVEWNGLKYVFGGDSQISFPKGRSNLHVSV